MVALTSRRLGWSPSSGLAKLHAGRGAAVTSVSDMKGDFLERF